MSKSKNVKCKGHVSWCGDNYVQFSIIEIDEDDELDVGSKCKVDFSHNPLEMARSLRAAAAWLEKNCDEAIDLSVD